jgi:hypothetical protein
MPSVRVRFRPGFFPAAFLELPKFLCHHVVGVGQRRQKQPGHSLIQDQPPSIPSPLSRLVHVPPCTAELSLATLAKAFFLLYAREGGGWGA